MSPIAPIALTAAGVAALLSTRREGAARVAWKVAASAGFVWLALSDGAPTASWEALLVAGLGAALFGDTILTLRTRWSFPAGTGAFLVMHLLYLTGFVAAGVRLASIAAATAVLGAVGIYVWGSIRSHLPDRLRRPVAVYMVAVVLDLAAGVSAALGGLGAALGAGILLVGFSDIAVVRRRFVSATPALRLVGLPAYYAGQLLVAWVVASSG